MADNWANFTAATAGAERASGQHQDQGPPPPQPEIVAAGGFEDDWGDFGGFEEASPAPPELAQQGPPPSVEASPSPWASFAIASVQNATAGQPDLLMAQTQSQPPQPLLDPPFADPTPSPVPPELTAQAEASRQQAQAQKAAPIQNQTITNSLEDIDVSLDDDINDRDAVGVGSAPSLHNHDVIPSPTLSPPDPNELPPASEGDEFPAGVRLFKRASSSIEVFAAEMTGKVARLEERLSASEREKRRLEMVREQLTHKLVALEQEVKGRRLAAEEQKQRYEELQARHAGELDEIRTAGHDALAIIVEEYKELCKCAVLQQQEASEKQVQVAIAAETKKCEEILQSQHDRLGSVLDEERRLNEDRIKECLVEQREAQERATEARLQAGREESRLELQRAVEEVTSNSREALERALKEERSKSKEMVEAHRVELGRLSEEERKCWRETSRGECEEERQRSREAIQAALLEERQHQQEAIEEAVAKAREGMAEYNVEQKRLDAVSRHRSMASLDLFLEGARQQLKSLMDDAPVEMLRTEPPASNPS